MNEDQKELNEIQKLLRLFFRQSRLSQEDICSIFGLKFVNETLNDLVSAKILKRELVGTDYYLYQMNTSFNRVQEALMNCGSSVLRFLLYFTDIEKE